MPSSALVPQTTNTVALLRSLPATCYEAFYLKTKFIHMWNTRTCAINRWQATNSISKKYAKIWKWTDTFVAHLQQHALWNNGEANFVSAYLASMAKRIFCQHFIMPRCCRRWSMPQSGKLKRLLAALRRFSFQLEELMRTWNLLQCPARFLSLLSLMLKGFCVLVSVRILFCSKEKMHQKTEWAALPCSRTFFVWPCDLALNMQVAACLELLPICNTNECRWIDPISFNDRDEFGGVTHRRSGGRL